LIGIGSNRSAVGTVIELYGARGTMIREVRAGESYGVSNSLSQIFGLGVHYTIQSLIIKWSSGAASTYIDIDANQLLIISESGCHPINVILSTNGNTTLCQGYDVELSIETNASSTIQWSDGSNNKLVIVTAAGEYIVTVTDLGGCRTVSRTIVVKENPLECLDPCEDNFVIHGFVNDDSFRAETFIKSNATTSDVEFHAQSFIELDTGIKVVATTTFLA